jgi:SAM-dependent methyltransferase
MIRRAFVRNARGIVTVARRRGFGYFGYLVKNVVWPSLVYRFAISESSPAALRKLLSTLGEHRATPVSAAELRTLKLIADAPALPAAASSAELEQLMDRAHAARITGLGDSFERTVRMADGSLRFADLPRSKKYACWTMSFLAARDADRRAFNHRFGTSILTESSARAELQAHKSRVPEGYRDYAPIDFGSGLTIGRIASTDSGTGRWEFLNRRIVAPFVQGKRVLDLGSNNGSLPLMMLRAGAREVVGIEYTPAIADFARLNARILSWRDVRPYSIDIVTGDMRLFLTEDLGAFDVITAFCSLYYLPEEDMARVVEKAAMMNAVLILQANDAVEGLPGTTRALHRLMNDHGYRDVTIHAPAGYLRPLLVGQPAADARVLRHATRL